MIALLAIPCLGGELPVLWQAPQGFGGTLRDIASRLPADTQAKDDDLITYAHEGNHFLSRGGRNSHRIYVGDGRLWEIPTPPLDTAAVFAAIPESIRHNDVSRTLYETYRRQGQHPYWRKQPLMILDEWRAYTAGSRTRHETRMTRRAETVRHTQTFTGYAKVLYDMAKSVEGYDATEMRSFCRWNLAQCREIPGYQSEVEFD